VSQQWSRALLDVQIALDSDIDRAREAMNGGADVRTRRSSRSPRYGACRASPAEITIRLVAKTEPLERWRIMGYCGSGSRLSSTGWIDVPPPALEWT
jgi:hypothetical protein